MSSLVFCMNQLVNILFDQKKQGIQVLLLVAFVSQLLITLVFQTQFTDHILTPNKFNLTILTTNKFSLTKMMMTLH